MEPLVSLGFSRFSKLVQPSLLGHERCGQLSCLPHGCEASIVSSGDRFFDLSSREGLRLVSGTPQRTMEPLKIATGLLPWEILAIAEEDFNLGGVIQHHLGGLFAFALQRTLLQFGPHLGMGVFFQFFQLRTNTRDNSLADTCTPNFQIQSGGWDNRWSGGVKRASLVHYVVCHVPSSTHSSW